MSLPTPLDRLRRRPLHLLRLQPRPGLRLHPRARLRSGPRRGEVSSATPPTSSCSPSGAAP
eukprot:4488159-Alexandrium_andersonii.AAC.1